jgi:hypothetical protein
MFKKIVAWFKSLFNKKVVKAADVTLPEIVPVPFYSLKEWRKLRAKRKIAKASKIRNR